MRSLTTAWGSLLVALALWGGFGFLVSQVSAERERYATLKADIAQQEGREKTATGLRSLLRDTKDERDALIQLSSTDVLAAAATIEAAGQAAGVDVIIESAATTPLGGKQTKELHEVVVVAHAEGTQQALLKAASLFESLPFPSRVQSYELQSIPSTNARTERWSMTMRVRIVTPSDNGA
jgi:hypothetical protein